MAKVNYIRYSLTFVFFVLINIDVSTSGGPRNFACDQVGPCRCKQHSGDLIDLSPLENFTSLEPDWRFLTASNNQGIYFYHPCSDISLPYPTKTECSHGCSLCLFIAQNPGNAPLDARVVLSGTGKGEVHCIATAGQAIFQPSESEIHLVYRSNNISVTINLECDESSHANSVLSLKVADSPIILTNHALILHSPYSCFCSITNNKHHMSGFGVFCLILITIAAAYFFGGMLVLRHIKGATGTEMIPNYDFWVSLSRRIKNGFNRLTGRESQEGDSYERI